MDVKNIKLDQLETDIFSKVAQEAATFISTGGKLNTSTQLRKFYDELSMWHDKVSQAASRDDAYRNAEPFIHMLKAKAAYSEGRGHVDKNFVEVFNHMIEQIRSPETLRNAKLFFEAVLGFRKASESK